VKQTFFKITAVFFLIMIFLPVSLGAFDFGLVLNQHVGVDNKQDNEAKVDYLADILPSFSGLIGDNGEFYISAGMTLGYENEFVYIPELLRTEISMRFGISGFKAGRIHYSDPLSFIASGLFDGAQFSHTRDIGTFNAGILYTGLLYKKNANITMTASDKARFDSAVDYGDFYKTYFAPPRLLAAVGWEHPSIAEFIRLKASIIGQLDLSREDIKYHSQYFIVKAGIPVKSLLFEFGGSMEFSQTVTPDDSNFNVSFAGDFGIFCTLPTSYFSRLSFNGTIAGGKKNDTVSAFVPVTTRYYGNIFEEKLSGLSVLSLNYSARIAETLGTAVSASYFIRNDLGTYSGYPVNGLQSDGYLLGAEFFARLIWSPVSDLQFNLGGGVFFPYLDIEGPDEKPQWRVELTAVLAVY